MAEDRRKDTAWGSETLNGAVLDSMLAHVAVLDREGNIRAVNERWRRFARENAADSGGPPPEFYIGTNYLELCRGCSGEHAGAAMATHDGILDVIDGRRESYTLVYPCHTPTRVYWFSMSVTPLAGGWDGAIVAHSDITDFWEAELALSESQARFATIFHASPIALSMSRVSDARLVNVNRAFGQTFGYAPSEAIGSSAVQLKLWVNPGERDRLVGLLRERGRVTEFEAQFMRKSGDILDALVSAELIELSGEPHVLSMVRDITERKRADRERAEAFALLDTLFASAPIGLAFVSPELRFLRINEWLASVDGASAAAHLGRRPGEILPAPLAGQVEANYRHVIETGEPLLNLEFDAEAPDCPGVLRHWLLNYYPVIDAAGQVLGGGAIVQDLTERKQAEAERESLQRQLQQAQKMEAIGLLAGGIAHDFNNILASMLGYTSLALARHIPDPDSKLAAYLREVKTAGERGRDLIAKLLIFSRGGARREPEPLVPHLLVKEVARLLASAIPSNIEIVARLDRTPPILIEPGDLHQAVTNLAINARDAMDGNGRIEIGLRPGLHEGAVCTSCHQPVQGEYVELSVEDTGCGIPAELLPRIFDPFFTTKDIGKGSGLGLSVVHGIVHHAGGHVLVQSGPGGTRFRLLFPLAVPGTAEAAPPERPWPKPPASGPRVMVVDDEPALAKLLGELLEAYGCRASVFTDSREALDCFRAEPAAFDLVITDQTMPGLTGVELSKALLSLRPELPIVLCSGYSEYIGAEEAARRGIRHAFQKPVRLDELLRVLAQPEPNDSP